MARLYFNFKSNLRKSCDDIPTPQVDYIALYTKKGHIISLSCNMNSDFGISTKGEYFARFKGVDCQIALNSDININPDPSHDSEEISSNDFDIISNNEITEVEIGLYIDDSRYEENFVPKLKNLSLEIEMYDRNFKYFNKDINVILY